MSSMVKHLRNNSARMEKLEKLGAQGSLKHARKGEHAPRKYATGGGVMGADIGGAPAKPRLDRPGRKMGGKGKKPGTNVNVIVMPKGGEGAMPPPPGGPMAGPPMPPPGPHPMPPPPGAGPGPGGPPMPPMRKHGGAVGKFAKGGRVKRDAGGSVSDSGDEADNRKRDRISEDSKKAARENRSNSEADAIAGRGLAGVGAAGMLAARRFGKLPWAGATGLGVGMLSKSNAEAKEADRIEKGLAKEGEEDRKSGGKVSKRGKR